MLNAEMCNRRNKPIFHGTIFLALVAGLGYTFYLYKLTKIDLDIARAEADKHLKQQESLSSQLQVVYEHRARLERSLQKEKTDHKSTKLEFSKKQNDFLLNITRSKHEAMNRFNSLETQYNMLKAQSKELDADYGRLQQTYSRLSAEHASVTNQQKRNFQLFKEQKANEISSLEEEIRTLKQQVVSLRTNLRSKSDEVEQYKHSSSRAVAASQQYQEKLKDLQGQLSRYQERLSSYVSRSKTSHRDVKLDKKREQGQESKLQDALSPTTIKSKDGQEGQHKKTENPTVPFRNDSRLHHDRSRREVNEQVALPSDNDAGIADMRKSPDENVYEQRKVKEGYTAEESYDSMKNIPLKDSNVNYGAHQAGYGVKVVSPGDGNAMNKWADILKQAAEQSRREGNVGVSKELAGETELGKSRLDDYRKQETVAAGDNDHRQLGEEEVKDKQDGEPVVNQYSDADRMQAGKPVVKGGQTDGRSIQTDHVVDRPGEQGDQQKNDHVLQAGHVADRPGEQEDQEGEEEQEEEGEEEDLKEDGAADISRDSINSQVAEMRENHQQQQEKQRGQLEGAQVQQHVAPIQAVQRQAEEQRTQGAELAQAYQRMAPIQAVQRQAEEQRTQRADLAQTQQHVAPIQAVQRQQEEHKAQQADADDEDAGDDGNEQEADPDEKDPDDAGEKEEEEEDQNSRQHQVHYGDRTLKGANKQ